MDHLSRLWHQITPSKREKEKKSWRHAEDGVHGI